MKVNGSDFKFAFRKISNADLRAVMLQFKPHASTTVELQSPASPNSSNTSNTGFEFVHLTDDTSLQTEQHTASIYDINVSFATPLVSNISVLSSGNITKGSVDTVQIGSNVPSSLFCVVKLNDITVDELFVTGNNIHHYLCVNGKVSGETSLSSKYYPINSSDVIKIDDYTMLIVFNLVAFTETTLPDFKAYTIENGEAVYKNVTILDCGMVTYAAQAS